VRLRIGVGGSADEQDKLGFAVAQDFGQLGFAVANDQRLLGFVRLACAFAAWA
jgi:hypothetical protein